MSTTNQERSVSEIIALFESKAFEGMNHEGYTPTSVIDAMLESDKLNHDRSKIITDSMLIFDENLKWLMTITDTLRVMIMSLRRKKMRWKAILIVLSGTISQLIAVRRLLLSGLDYPAKQILRCLVEHIDLAVSLSLDEPLVAEFLRFNKLSGPLGAREFWSKYIRKGKNYHLRGHVNLRREIAVGKQTAEAWEKYRAQEEELLNACVHPCHAAAAINLTGTEYVSAPDVAVSGIPYYGLIDEASNRTIDYAIMSMLDYVIFGYLPTYEEVPRSARNDPETGKFLKAACEHIERGRRVILGLASYHAEAINREAATRQTAHRANRRE